MKAFGGATVRAGIITSIVLAAVVAGAAFAQDPATNKPAPQQTFRTPLVRDLDLLDQVRALAARVTALEAKNTELVKKVADLEAKVAAVRK